MSLLLHWTHLRHDSRDGCSRTRVYVNMPEGLQYCFVVEYMCLLCTI
jgi:hypothetical protein